MRPVAFLAIAALFLAVMACSITPRFSSTESGPVETFTIAEPYPDDSPADLRVEMGAGRLNIGTGSSELVSGTVEYNVEDWEPEIDHSGSRVTISQRDLNINFPDNDLRNDWDLQLGDQPLRLQLSAGAYQGRLDLGGLALTEVDISDGASQAEVHIDQPNLETMSRFAYKTGASEVKIYGLGNANAEEIRFESGAGSYVLDFSGELQQDSRVAVTSGLSNVELIFPENANVRVNVSGGLNNVDLNGRWDVSGNVYVRSSSGPLIDVRVEMGLGNLELTVD